MFKVNVTARNPKLEELTTQPVEALVDSGSELTWLPAEILKRAGITPRRKRVFATATRQKIEREVGYAILSAEGYETNDEVVFAEPGDMTLLGVRTLEGLGSWWTTSLIGLSPPRPLWQWLNCGLADSTTRLSPFIRSPKFKVLR